MRYEDKTNEIDYVQANPAERHIVAQALNRAFQPAAKGGRVIEVDPVHVQKTQDGSYVVSIETGLPRAHIPSGKKASRRAIADVLQEAGFDVSAGNYTVIRQGRPYQTFDGPQVMPTHIQLKPSAFPAHAAGGLMVCR